MEMQRLPCYRVFLALALGYPATASTYVNCDRSIGDWSSSYFVGELEFNAETGDATGTSTHYNYRKVGPDDVRECHVTYELTGIYEPVSALFLLDAHRTNLSQACSSEFIEAGFPQETWRVMQVHLDSDDGVEISRADNGEIIASGILREGSLVYRTEESCL